MLLTQKLGLLQLERDPEIQARAVLNHDRVREYSEAMGRGDTFPPVEATWDGEHYWLTDGWHRCKAYENLKVEEIEVKVTRGARRDALMRAAKANATHGLPRTWEDKRRAVLRLLKDPEWTLWSDSKIGRELRVSQPFVRKLRVQLSYNVIGYEAPTTRKVQRGGTVYEMNTSGIREAAQERSALPEHSDSPQAYDRYTGQSVIDVGQTEEWQYKTDKPAHQVVEADATDFYEDDVEEVEELEYVEEPEDSPAPPEPIHATETEAPTAREILHSSATDKWYTPAPIIELARLVMGGIDLDPASCEEANTIVGAEAFYTAQDDGLSKRWWGRVWCNPPYGKVDGKSSKAAWAKAMEGRYEHGEFEEGIFLVDAATATNWFHSLWHRPVVFIKGRLSFLKPDGLEPGESNTHGTALFYFGSNTELFAEVFGQRGRVVPAQEGYNG